MLEQAQSYSSLGQPRAAITLLCGAYSGDQVCVRESALQIARAQKDRQTEAAVLGSLGNAYLLMGEYNQAIAYLQASLKVANEINNQVIALLP